MIDVCRPGSEDVHAPGMQPLAEAIARDEDLGRAYQATQRADAAIGKAFRAVSPPDGLATRLLEGMEAAAKDAAETPTEPVTRDRRGLLVWGPLLGLAAAAGALFVFAPFNTEANFADDAEREAVVARWVSQAAAEEGWHDSSTAPAEYPRPQYVSAKLARWKLLEGGRTVCYQFRVGSDKLAVLFVTKQTSVGLPAEPRLPLATTAATSLSTAWANQGNVYVLAVFVSEGSAHDLSRDLIRLRAA